MVDFEWIAIHREAMGKVLEYEDRQEELIEILQGMHDAGLKAILLNDRDEEGRQFRMRHIDPFTFLSNFCRTITWENRSALWRFLKNHWDLKSAVPEDFSGIPVSNNQQSWWFPYSYQMDEGHIGFLWKLAKLGYHGEPEGFDGELFDRCYGLRGIGQAYLTMGLYWINPEKFLSLDGVNRQALKKLGIRGKIGSYEDYLRVFSEFRELIEVPIPEFSFRSWQAAMAPDYGAPFDAFFAEFDADEVLNCFGEILEVLEQSEGFRRELVTTNCRVSPRDCLRINYGPLALFSFYPKSGAESFGLLLTGELAARHGLEKIGSPGEKYWDGASPLVWGAVDGEQFMAGEEELWEEFLAFLPKLVGNFSHWKRSPYRNSHREEVRGLMEGGAARESLLRSGLENVSEGDEVDDISDEEGPTFWLVAPGAGGKYWNQFKEDQELAIGWDGVGDLRDFDGRLEIQNRCQEVFPDQGHWNIGCMMDDFANRMSEGDIVIAKNGNRKVLGWGVLRGEYRFEAERPYFKHVWSCEWKTSEEITLAEHLRKFPVKTLTEMKNHAEVIAWLGQEFEVSFVEGDEEGKVEADGEDQLEPVYGREDALRDLFMPAEDLDRITRQLLRKKNVILEGPPGVGKTFVAKRLAYLLQGRRDDSGIEVVQFHQSYAYEDFMQGLRPTKDGRFEVQNGVFYRLASRAGLEPKKKFFLVIDEINRGNLSKIFGELMMLIEHDKRGAGHAVSLTYSGKGSPPFSVPENLYLIGTMNTADRSLSMVDFALRRRFAFLRLRPEFLSDTFRNHLLGAGVSSALVDHIIMGMGQLNEEILADRVGLGSGYEIGHSFFTPAGFVENEAEWYGDILEFEVLPLLAEYFVDQPEKVEEYRDVLEF